MERFSSCTRAIKRDSDSGATTLHKRVSDRLHGLDKALHAMHGALERLLRPGERHHVSILQRKWAIPVASSFDTVNSTRLPERSCVFFGFLGHELQDEFK